MPLQAWVTLILLASLDVRLNGVGQAPYLGGFPGVGIRAWP